MIRNRNTCARPPCENTYFGDDEICPICRTKYPGWTPPTPVPTWKVAIFLVIIAAFTLVVLNMTCAGCDVLTDPPINTEGTK